MGMNAKTAHPEEAKTFLSWVASREFAELYANALPGFFPLSNAKVTLDDPLANEFLSWRQDCQSTIRNSYQILSRGTPNLENELWRVSAAVMNKHHDPGAGWPGDPGRPGLSGINLPQVSLLVFFLHPGGHCPPG